MERRIAIVWHEGSREGEIEVRHGRLKALAVVVGEGRADGARFSANGPARLDVAVDDVRVGPGPDPTVISVRAGDTAFSVALRDVCRAYPVFLPELGVAVTEATDPRTCDEIAAAIRKSGARTHLQRIASEPEESYAAAAAVTRNLRCPTWLGLSRDMRLFEVDYVANGTPHVIRPRRHGTHIEREGQPVNHFFVLGRGAGCVEDLTRELDDRTLPILHATKVDEDVTYRAVAFATLETSPLRRDTLRGTHYLVADGFAGGHRFTEEQERRFQELLPAETNPDDEEVVLYLRALAENHADAPRFAWFAAALVNGASEYDGERGFGLFPDGSVYALLTLDGKPLPQREIAVLVPPRGSATFEIRLPHRPIPPDRAARLAGQDFDARLEECRAFWRDKLERAARVRVPERRVDEMIHAGLLHLDIVAYGREPDGPVAPTIGVYSPIGSESSPIIQFIDSMGRHDLARRCLHYFLEKQHDDGFMQNFDGYMLETGAALWSMGEHFRYTRDTAWVASIADKLLLSCNYLVDWRRRNQVEELRGKAFGLLDGKVADPEDPYRQFMLNGYACAGLARAAEMLADLRPEAAERLRSEARGLRDDIRTALFDAMARCPVVPLGDGTWCPPAPAWAEASSPTYLMTEGKPQYTHGTFCARETLVGPHYLILQGVLDPRERAADWIVHSITDLLHYRNVALSQPYYSPHPYAHLRRGEAKAFLKTFYNAFSGLADRETYTFWEHYFHASPHKTHEEGWFLMQTRWMLYLEEGDTLRLFPGVPRAWLAEGPVEFDRVASYFGPVSAHLAFDEKRKRNTARVTCGSDRCPAAIEFRLPHPAGARPKKASLGELDAERELVTLRSFEGSAEVVVEY